MAEDRCRPFAAGKIKGIGYTHTYVPYEDEFRDGMHVLRMEWRGMNVMVIAASVKDSAPVDRTTTIMFPDVMLRGELYLVVEAPSKELWVNARSRPVRWRKNEPVRLNWYMGSRMMAVLSQDGYGIRSRQYSSWASVETNRMSKGGNTITWKEMYDLGRFVLDRLIRTSLATLRRDGQVLARRDGCVRTVWTFVGGHPSAWNTEASPEKRQE